MLTTLTRTFQESVYVELHGAKTWEVEIEVSGVRQTPEYGMNEIEVYGLEVVSAQRVEFDGEFTPITTPRQLEWLDQIVNDRYWRGQLDEIDQRVIDVLSE